MPSTFDDLHLREIRADITDTTQQSHTNENNPDIIRKDVKSVVVSYILITFGITSD